MAKYIDRDALVEWLKRVPLKDLSDGLGLCRVIMEDDFKKAIKKMPKGIIADVVPVVHCKGCKHLQCCKFTQFLGDDGYCSYGEYKFNTEDIKWQTKR